MAIIIGTFDDDPDCRLDSSTINCVFYARWIGQRKDINCGAFFVSLEIPSHLFFIHVNSFTSVVHLSRLSRDVLKCMLHVCLVLWLISFTKYDIRHVAYLLFFRGWLFIYEINTLKCRCAFLDDSFLLLLQTKHVVNRNGENDKP